MFSMLTATYSCYSGEEACEGINNWPLCAGDDGAADDALTLIITPHQGSQADHQQQGGRGPGGDHAAGTPTASQHGRHS